MNAIDPAYRIRPSWWSTDTYIHLAALEDGALPCKGLSPQARESPTLPILGLLLSAIWALGQTANLTKANERAMEQLQNAELRARRAAEEARLTVSRLTDRTYDDELAGYERKCEQTDPGWGPPQAHLTRLSFTVRLPGYSGDQVTTMVHIDNEGRLTSSGTGPLTDLDGLDRLDLRAAIATLEQLVERSATHSQQQ
ncbi:hypothetical protein [Streptomyces yaizuensis]|uniref:Uncharacterized protein n=1 Tax=Streptomyces yaizuensis TaxID=2989713 RepID=A0ABQ5P6E9_9ACTN|nr:hypothetical protein [Streptomyces sp. YSPA8]GLF98156.1 hypothetical protein SYYSPA8_27685 [Streptomyces sp. YSPA8]